MFTLPGYEVSAKIHENPNTLVYRAVRTEDNQPVILKVLEAENQFALQKERLQQDFNISRSLDTDHVVTPYNLEKYPDKWVLIMEDFGGDSVKHLSAGKPFALAKAVSLAIKATTILADIHHGNIIHKDIKPSNFILNPDTGQLKITDFGISTAAEQKAPVIKSTNIIEGTLAYMSPEQTGRTNRSVDYRTDLYSLGVTLYEWFTGKLPFQTEDPLELTHCHLAKQPPPPHSITPGVPDQISDIIIKLLAKSPEDRYQNTQGLRLDLELCRKQLALNGRVEKFPLGRFDVSETFIIPDKLYGRETQLKQLLDACNRSRDGAVGFFLVKGPAGVGKSALVDEVRNEIRKERGGGKGFFLHGKFDQFSRDIAYSAIGQAFKGLVMELLGEMEEQLQTWKEKMQKAWGPNGKLITDVVPDLELVVGKQPEPAKLGPYESRNRFKQVLRNFVRVFAGREHPLVLFLDDLQWADTASLDLVESLATDPEIGFLFLVGTCRDNEVDRLHPLTATLKKLRASKVPAGEITLEPLGEEVIEKIILDTCPADPEKVKHLAKIAFRKTGGNPFFIKKLLLSLNLDGLVFYSTETCHWDWDERKLEEVRISENVLEFMILLLEKLPEATKEALKLASCIGNHFEAETLAWASGCPGEELTGNLAEAIREEILVTEKVLLPGPRNTLITTYKFQHDRLHEAAYTMIPVEKRKRIHLRLGRYWLEQGTEEKIAGTLFDIAWQFNEAGPLITGKNEKTEIARLYLKAAAKAKESTAFKNAASYLEHAANILGPGSWETGHDLTWEIYHQKAENEFSSAMLDESEKTIKIALANSTCVDEKVAVYKIYLQVLFQFSRHYDAIEVVREVLALLGISLPKHVKKRHIAGQYAKFYLRLGRKKTGHLMTLPEITDKRRLNICALIYDAIPSTYMVAPDLMAYLSMIMANICIRHGNSIYAPFAYAMVSCVMTGVTKQYKMAYDFAMMAIRLNKKYPHLDVKARIHFLAGFFPVHWVKPVKEYLPLWETAFKTTLEAGNIHWHNYCITFSRPQDILFNDAHLAEIEAGNAKHYEMHVHSKDREVSFNQFFLLKFIRRLRGIEEPPQAYHAPDDFGEESYAGEMATPGNYLMRMYYYTFNLVEAFTSEDYESALRHARRGNKIVIEVLGNLSDFVLRFYTLLTIQALKPKLSRLERLKLAIPYKIDKYLIKRAAGHCPGNFRAQYLLVLAEEARTGKDDSKAIHYYEQAIKESRGENFPRVTALCYELAGKYYLERGIFNAARPYLTAAHTHYKRWGAGAKAKQLEEKYPRFFPRGSMTPVDSVTGAENMFDLVSVMKASQAISMEINLEKLLGQLLNIIIENAGAQKGVLVLETIDGPAVEGVINAATNHAQVLQAIPLEGCGLLPENMVRLVQRTGKQLLLEDASRDHDYSKDPYIIEKQPRSVLCVPLKRKDRVDGVLYLENTLAGGSFTEERGRMLDTLLTQAAISIENARLYSELERDISERKRAEQALRESEEQLRQSQKLESIGRLAGGIAHDFNNILTAINGYSEMALMKLDEKKRVSKYIKHVLESSKIAENMVRQLLAFSSKQVVQPRILDVNLTLFDLQKMLRRMIGEDIEIQLNLADNIPCIQADPAQLEQVVMNLFVNSRDAVNSNTKNAPGKTITLETDGVLLDEEDVAVYADGGPGQYILITIGDNGMGMDQLTMSKIFDPFFTTKGVGKGTGLGLSTVYGIVKQNNGFIYVHSEPGVGTAFKIFWPALDRDITAKKNTGETEHVTGGSETILFVEDDERVKDIYAGSLRSFGYNVYEASNGVIALELVRDKKLEIDLLVTDLIMPGMNGKKLAQKLKVILPSAGVLYCSGYSEDLVVNNGSISEEIHFMPKPYSGNALAKKVRDILDGESLAEGPGPSRPGKTPAAMAAKKRKEESNDG